MWPIRPWASWFMNLPVEPLGSILDRNKKNYNRQNINKSTANVIIIEIIPNKYFISRNFLKRHSLLTEKKKKKTKLTFRSI